MGSARWGEVGCWLGVRPVEQPVVGSRTREQACKACSIGPPAGELLANPRRTCSGSPPCQCSQLSNSTLSAATAASAHLLWCVHLAGTHSPASAPTAQPQQPQHSLSSRSNSALSSLSAPARGWPPCRYRWPTRARRQSPRWTSQSPCPPAPAKEGGGKQGEGRWARGAVDTPSGERNSRP